VTWKEATTGEDAAAAAAWVIEEEDSGMEKVGVLGWGHLWAALLGCVGNCWPTLFSGFLGFFFVLGNA
jgi:hypothetical protein